MYLSRVKLDLTRRATMQALVEPQKLHGAVESSFAGERQRRLWRLDRLHGVPYLLLLSEEKPDLTALAAQFGPVNGEGEVCTKDYTPLLARIANGSTWQFRLTANPTKSCPQTGQGARGSVKAHCTVAYQKQWLVQRAEKHGFALDPDGFTVTGSRWLHFRKGKEGARPVTLLSVTYEGTLQVTDAEAFTGMLTHGIGRGKAYGLGLMTIACRR